MIERTFIVKARLGLHARAAAKLVREANKFQSRLSLARIDGGSQADAKSILSVLMLAASRGTELRAIVEGPDEQAAISALDRLFCDGFGEADSSLSLREQNELHCHGVGVSEGVVIGSVLRMHNGAQYVYRARIEDAELDRELRRFRAAVRLARHQLQGIKERAEKELGKDHAYIFDAHLLLLEDEKLINDVEKFIQQQRTNAEWALKVVSDRLLAVYSEIKDDYLRERGSDIDDVVQRLLVALRGETPLHRQLSQDAVIVSQDLLPSAVAELDLQYARAVVTDAGGWTSHMAIIARGLGLPAVVGLRDFFRRARTGDAIIVDSRRNEVILHPSSETVARYQAEAQDQKRSRSSASQNEYQAESSPLRTLNGVELTLRANVELPAEFDGVGKYRAKGVGLYRSEFLLARRSVMISEEEQYAAYSEIGRVAGADGAIIRLFDLGAERRPDAGEEPEKNPALGLRAIRYGLVHEEIMRTQVRAILRAAADHRIDVVLPMIADVADVRRAQLILQEEQANLTRAAVPQGTVRLGAMIEIPSAVITAHKIAAIVDFFELGTNDLVQYTLAVDRGNEEVAPWYRTLHPAVLVSINRSLQAARSAGIPAIVCGEMASTPAYAVLLIGLGAVELSMTPSSIPRIRGVLSQIDTAEAEVIALECLECETADQVEDVVRERFRERWPELFPLHSLPAAREGD
jgi:phosphotransferase system enzyme I (PtsI)